MKSLEGIHPGDSVVITTYVWEGGSHAEKIAGVVENVDENFITVSHTKVHKYDIKTVEIE